MKMNLEKRAAKAAELLERLEQLVPEPDPNLVKMADEAMAMGVETTPPSTEYREALLVLDDTTYLHVQPCDTAGTTRSTMWRP